MLWGERTPAACANAAELLSRHGSTRGIAERAHTGRAAVGEQLAKRDSVPDPGAAGGAALRVRHLGAAGVGGPQLECDAGDTGARGRAQRALRDKPHAAIRGNHRVRRLRLRAARKY